MKICQEHWAKLKAAISERGLDHLVAKSGEEAFDGVVTELQGGKSEYDPLMSCNNMIWNVGLQQGGLYLMGKKEDGTQFCPICESLEHQLPPEGMTKAQQEASWINGPADIALEHARKLSLMPKVQ